MEQLFELLDKKFEPVWTIIAVIIGGVISYVSTSRAEKVKNKIQLQREKLEQILIPYCTCLEDVMAEINKVYTMEKNLDKDILQQWFINLKKPFEYLKASKRVYLSLESKKLLEEYKDLINCFEEELQKEYSLFLREYEEFLKERLVEFVNIPKPDKTNIYMDKTAENKVKLAIINKTKITLLGNIDLVIAVYGEDSECYNSTYINIGNKSRENWDLINHRIASPEDYDIEDQIAFLLLDFIYNEIKDDGKLMDKIINIISIESLLNSIEKKSSDMTKILLEEIDEITK